MKGLVKLTVGALLGVLLVTSGAFAQDYLELVRSDLKTLKVAMVTEAMELNQEQSDKFWPIYRKYEAKLSQVYDQRIAIIMEFGANYETMSNEKAKELALDLLASDKKRAQLWKKYFYQVERALSSTIAARFVQVERQINLLIDLQIASEMPLIKEP